MLGQFHVLHFEVGHFSYGNLELLNLFAFDASVVCLTIMT